MFDYSQALVSWIVGKECVEKDLALSTCTILLHSFSLTHFPSWMAFEETIAVIVEERWFSNSTMSHAAMSNVPCNRGTSCLLSWFHLESS